MTKQRSDAIQIQNAFGVTHPFGDTHLLAQEAANVDGPPGRALDLGTGSGYVAIHLAQRGWDVDLVDISPRALQLAQRNARHNGVNIRVFQSNWFDAVRGPYDVIACNPPMSAVESERRRLVTATMRHVPQIAWRLLSLTQPLLERKRFTLLRALALGARPLLRQDGRLLLVISPEEADLLVRRTEGLDHVENRTPSAAPPNLVVATFRFAQSPASKLSVAGWLVSLLDEAVLLPELMAYL